MQAIKPVSPSKIFTSKRKKSTFRKEKKKPENYKCNSELSNPHTFNLQDALEFAT